MDTVQHQWLDRLTSSIALALLALLGAGIFLVAAGALDPHALVGDDALRDSLFGFSEGTPMRRLAIGGIGLAVGLGATALIVSRVGTGRLRGADAHVVEQDDDGVVMVERAGVEHVAEAAVVRCRGVVTAVARVRGSLRGPVRLRVDVGVHGGANLQQTGAAARSAAKTAVERMAGLEVSDVTVNVGVLPFDSERGLA